MHLSIDVGGTFIKYAWFSKNQEIVERGKRKTPLSSIEDFFDVIKSIWDENNSEKTGLSFSLPGTIDPDTGFVFQGGSLTYHVGVNIKEMYEKAFGVPVSVENDARCAAIAEMTSGNMKDIETGIVLTFGTGVGGCLIIDKKIHRGAHLFSGEVSGLVTQDIRKEGINAILGRKLGIGVFARHVSELKGVAPADGYEVFEWIENGDPIAVEAFNEYCEILAMQLFNMQILLDPKRVCIGGGISENPVFIEGIQKAMEAYYGYFPIPLPRFELMACKYHNDANILGAYAHFSSLYS